MGAALKAIKELMERLNSTVGARLADIATDKSMVMAPDVAERLREATVLMRRQNLGDLKTKRRLLNVHESGKTATPHGGKKAAEVRSLMEPQLLGGVDINYGYLTEDPHATFKLPLSTWYPDRGDTFLMSDSAVGPYGEFALELAPHARARTSFTLGDSLDGSRGPTAANDIVTPFSPWQDIASEGSPLKRLAREYDKMRSDAYEQFKIDEPQYNGDRWRFEEYFDARGMPDTFDAFLTQRLGARPPALRGKNDRGYSFTRISPRPLNAPDWKPLQPSEKLMLEKSTLDNMLRREGENSIQGYIEAQVHGGVGPEDIRRIYHLAPEGSSATEKELRKLGIEYVPPPEDNVAARIKRLGLRTYGDLIRELGPEVYKQGSRYDLDRGPLREYDMNFNFSELPKKVRFAEGGSIKPIPQNSALGMLAEALRAARGFGNRAELPILGGVGDLLLGKSPEEIEDWSFGNSPFDRGYPGIGDRLPRVKPRRKEQLADTLTTLPGLIPIGTVGRGAKSVGREALRRMDEAMLTGQGPLAQLAGAARPMTAVRPRGGNFKSDDVSRYLINELGVDDPKMSDALREFDMDVTRQPRESDAVRAWGGTQLRNYLTKDLGAPTDPLLQIEKEFPDLHLPPGILEGERPGADIINALRNGENLSDPLIGGLGSNSRAHFARYAKQHFGLTDQPLTPWGRLSDAEVTQSVAGRDLVNELRDKYRLPEMVLSDAVSGKDFNYEASLDDLVRSAERYLAEGFGRNLEVRPDGTRGKVSDRIQAFIDDAKTSTDWRKKSPDAPTYGLVGDDRSLGFNHVLDYLEAATEPHKWVAEYGEEGQAILDGIRSGKSLDEIMLSQLTPIPRAAIERVKRLADAGLSLDPESLKRLSVADAVKKTAQWNEFMTAQNVADGLLSKGWKEFKAYPDKGMKWVEFGKPELSADEVAAVKVPYGDPRFEIPEDVQESLDRQIRHILRGRGTREGTDDYMMEFEALRTDMYQNWADEHPKLLTERQNALREGLSAEGDAMGHCVGGYCDDVLSRGTKIYSLRDAKGRPHVTVEVRPAKDAVGEWLNNMPEDLYQAHLNRFEELMGPEWQWPQVRGAAKEWHDYVRKLPGVPEQPMGDIVQIKGKGNAAPADSYLPFVQDFVKSGKWGRVGDLRNTGLVHFSGGKTRYRAAPGAEPMDLDMPSGYMTSAEAAEHLIKQGAPEAWARQHVGDFSTNQRRGYKEGGLIERDPPGFLPRDLGEWVDQLERLYATAP